MQYKCMQPECKQTKKLIPKSVTALEWKLTKLEGLWQIKSVIIFKNTKHVKFCCVDNLK